MEPISGSPVVSPEGSQPVAANRTSDPQAYTSACPVTFSGSAERCSGADQRGEEICWPVARAIPRSTTRGPAGDMITLLGSRARWSAPTACPAARASASPAARAVSMPPVSGPCSATCAARVCPGMYEETSHGSVTRASALRCAAVQRERTRARRLNSASSRARAPGVPASGAGTTRITEAEPVSSTPSRAVPAASRVIRPITRRLPTTAGSPLAGRLTPGGRRSLSRDGVATVGPGGGFMGDVFPVGGGSQEGGTSMGPEGLTRSARGWFVPSPSVSGRRGSPG